MNSGKNLLFERGVYQDEKGRDFFFDNAKFLLIMLVVMGHFMSPLKTGNDTLTLLWRLVNTLHMPCLIFISGYFAKRYITKGGIKVQRPFTYALLYVTAQIAVRLFEHFVLKKAVPTSMFFAASSLWFLQCLFWWYLLLPLLDCFRKEYVMPFVILLGIFSGYDSRIGDLLAFSRMLNHLPFFMAGYYMTKDSVQKLFTRKARLLSIPALLLPIGFYYLLSLKLTTGLTVINSDISKVITSNYSFWNMPNVSKYMGIQSWWLLRVWFYALAACLCFAFLVWVPRCKTFFTVCCSLYVISFKFKVCGKTFTYIFFIIYNEESKFHFSPSFELLTIRFSIMCKGLIVG